MRLGPLAALDAIKHATGETKVHAIGYCVGGTLLSVTLAYMAAMRDTRIASATLFATQVDFTHAGDLKVFVDEDQLRAIEKRMTERGYLEGKKMATAFNMLRSNDLIWPYVINNYLRGKAPLPFDLLYWNSDATRMPAANHAFYLRNCYLENTLSQGQDGGRRREARSRQGENPGLQSRHPRGPHRAGAIGVARLEVLRRPGELRAVRLRPHRRRGQSADQGEISVLDRRQGRNRRRSRTGSTRPRNIPARGGRTGSSGSSTQDDTQVAPREPGGGKLTTIEDAPGSYVKVRD